MIFLVNFHVQFCLVFSKKAHLKGSSARKDTSTKSFDWRGGLTPPLHNPSFCSKRQYTDIFQLLDNVGKKSIQQKETYLEPFQTSKTNFFVKIVNQFQSLTIFAKSPILKVWQGSEYTSVNLIIKTNEPNKVKTNQDTSSVSVLEILEKPWSNF